MIDVVLITSNHLRHKYIAHCIAKQLKLKAVVCEKKNPSITSGVGFDEYEKVLLQKHFEERQLSEEKYFGAYQEFPQGIEKKDVSFGGANSEEVFAFIQNISPEYLLLFGSSIIKNPLLREYNGKIINLHLGLSPYYRGAATNFFPLVDKKPECIGATIHLAIDKVDAGGILYQLRPLLNGDERIHDIGNKVIQQAGEIFPRVVKAYSRGKIKPVRQDLTVGVVRRNKDFSPVMIKEVRKYIEDGLIKEYLNNKIERDSRFPIVATQI